MALEQQQAEMMKKGGALVKKNRTSTEGSKEVEEWTTTNMEYGNFYQSTSSGTAAGAADKPVEDINSEGPIDIHAECKLELAMVRKELEDCRAQLRNLNNSRSVADVAATDGDGITIDPQLADQRTATSERITKARFHPKLIGHNAGKMTAPTAGTIQDAADDDKIKPLHQSFRKLTSGSGHSRALNHVHHHGRQHRQDQLEAVKSHGTPQGKRKFMRSSSSSLKGVNNNMWSRQSSSMVHF